MADAGMDAELREGGSNDTERCPSTCAQEPALVQDVLQQLRVPSAC